MIDRDAALNRHAAILRELADKLKVPVEMFLAEPSDDDDNDLFTLMHLWSTIHDSQGRRRVLSLARQEAGRAGYKS